VTLAAWGYSGPWGERRGYDTVVQAANGFAHQAHGPRPLLTPCSAQDYVSGYLLALGTMVALHRRAAEGGSWMVRTSLARTGEWIRAHGETPEAEWSALPNELPTETLDGLINDHVSPLGTLTHLGPVVRMSKTPPHWSRPAVPLGYHRAEWPSAHMAAAAGTGA
jgi:crotonobetainyl-CoA:carnitine CoA-transferase CaiB-like acyl-CoA transferase